MKKRIIALVLLVALAVTAFAGCGQAGGKKRREGGAPLTGEQIKITSQLHGYGRTWLDNAAEEFTYRTGIEVVVEWDALLAANLITILENAKTVTSDMYIAPNIAEDTFLKEGWIEDLTDFMNEKDEAEGGLSLNDRMEEGVWQCVQMEDGSIRQGVVKISHPNFGVVYNKKIMNYLCHDVLGWEAGHDYPINTKELFEVVDALNQETAAGNNPELLTYVQDGRTLNVEAISWSGSTGSLEFFFRPWYAQYVGLENLEAFLEEKGDKPSMWTDPANFLVYQTICDLIGMTVDNNGNAYPANSIPNCVSYNHTASQSHFFLGKSLLLPGASWIYKEMEASIEDLNDWGYMPVPYLSDDEGNPLTKEGVEMPKNEDGSYCNFTYAQGRAADCAIIPISSQNKELCKQFLRFLTSSEYLPKLASDYQSPVAYKCDYSKVENISYWFEQTLHVNEVARVANWFTTNKMASAMSFYQATEVAPYTHLSLGTFGSVTKMVDSATGKELAPGEEPQGFAVTECVYKYVTENIKAGMVTWNRQKVMYGLY